MYTLHVKTSGKYFHFKGLFKHVTQQATGEVRQPLPRPLTQKQKGKSDSWIICFHWMLSSSSQKSNQVKHNTLHFHYQTNKTVTIRVMKTEHQLKPTKLAALTFLHKMLVQQPEQSGSFEHVGCLHFKTSRTCCRIDCLHTLPKMWSVLIS